MPSTHFIVYIDKPRFNNWNYEVSALIYNGAMKSTLQGGVNIRIQDTRRFADVALLLDRVDFLDNLHGLRKKWDSVIEVSQREKPHWLEIDIPSTKDNSVEHVVLFEEAEEILNDEVRTDDVEKYEEDMRHFFFFLEDAFRALPKYDFQFDIVGLRKKYRKPGNFDRVIAHSLLYNEVSDDDYVVCEVKMGANKREGIYDMSQFFYPDPTIVFYPGATLADIEQAFKNDGQRILKEYEDKFMKSTYSKTDTMNNIKRDRSWYWLKKQGLSYGQILKSAEKEGERLTRDGVIKAVKRYEKMLR